MEILCLDVGTLESGFCLLDSETYKPLKFGKINNEELLKIVKYDNYDVMVYEEFQSYGMPIGVSTLTSITWNGRYIQSALDRNKKVSRIYRKEEKINICGSLKAKDSNIRQALIDRFAKHDLKNGKGTKKEPDFFYGFKSDIWSSFCVGCTYLDKKNRGELNGHIN